MSEVVGVIGFMLLLVAVRHAINPVSHEKTLEQEAVQHPDMYLSHICHPGELPVEFYVKIGWRIFGIIFFILLFAGAEIMFVYEIIHATKEEFLVWLFITG